MRVWMYIGYISCTYFDTSMFQSKCKCINEFVFCFVFDKPLFLGVETTSKIQINAHRVLKNFIFFQFCGRMMMYVWLFLSNIAYVVIFAYTWSYGLMFIATYRYYYDGYDYFDLTRLRHTLLALLLIFTFTYSILNMYIICLVTKFGCCFVEGLEGDINNRSQNTEAQPLQVIPFNLSYNFKDIV